MNARSPVAPGGSANTMSRGSSPTSSVRTTRGGSRAGVDDADAVREVADDPHLGVGPPRPRRLEADRHGAGVGEAPVPAFTSKISSWLSGVLIANSRVWLGDSAMGRTRPSEGDERRAVGGEGGDARGSEGQKPPQA
jgi:hypothetical protein